MLASCKFRSTSFHFCKNCALRAQHLPRRSHLRRCRVATKEALCGRGFCDATRCRVLRASVCRLNMPSRAASKSSRFISENLDPENLATVTGSWVPSRQHAKHKPMPSDLMLSTCFCPNAPAFSCFCFFGFFLRTPGQHGLWLRGSPLSFRRSGPCGMSFFRFSSLPFQTSVMYQSIHYIIHGTLY